MAESFYPFVENGDTQSESDDTSLVVCHPARIAVYDDAAAAPRVVVIEPNDIRSYLEEITATVAKLAQDQGGKIPFTVVREIVENLIHAYFIEPTISILDGGNTIRFSDQGPGIQDKDRAMQYGTTSATNEMKRYIRGVGSGLPYVHQWLEDKGGSLTIEDNIHKGAIVTVSLVKENNPSEQALSQDGYPSQMQQGLSSTGQFYPLYSDVSQQSQGGWATQQAYQQPYPPQQGWPATPQGYPIQQQGFMPPSYGQPWQSNAYPYQTSPYQQPAANPQGQQPMVTSQERQPAINVSERGMVALQYLMSHESVGPRDLTAIQNLSEATWSRELSQLEAQGLISKQGGQKRKLTPLGRQFLGCSPKNIS